jgi:hypothetical protein
MPGPLSGHVIAQVLGHHLLQCRLRHPSGELFNNPPGTETTRRERTHRTRLDPGTREGTRTRRLRALQGGRGEQGQRAARTQRERNGHHADRAGRRRTRRTGRTSQLAARPAADDETNIAVRKGPGRARIHTLGTGPFPTPERLSADRSPAARPPVRAGARHAGGNPARCSHRGSRRAAR